MRVRTDGIKAMSRGFSGGGGGQTSVKFAITRIMKDDNGKLLVEVIIVTLGAVATVDVLKAKINDVNLVNSRSVRFVWLLNRRLVLIE